MVLAVGNGAQSIEVNRAVARHDYQVVEGTVSDFDGKLRQAAYDELCAGAYAECGDLAASRGDVG